MVKSLCKAAGTIVRLLFVICAFHFSIFFAVSANAGLEPINCGAGPCPEVLASGQLSGAAINSLGEVVWSQQDGQNPDQIFSSTRGQLTNEPKWHFSPAINNLGDMVWVEYSNGTPYGYTLRGIIAGQPVTLAASETNWIGDPDINDRGEVVWIQQDSQNYYQLYSNTRGQLTSGAYYCATPHINNQGDVVFTRSDGNVGPISNQVYKISAGSTTAVAVTSDVLDYRSTAINDSGEIVWSERDISNPASFSRVVSSVRGVLVPPTTELWGVDLNNCGDVVYVTNENGLNKLYRLGSSAPCATAHLGVFHGNGVWYIDSNGNGAWDGTSTDGLYTYGTGLTGAVPVIGDWTGHGTSKLGVYDNGVWYLDLSGNGAWDGTPTDGRFVHLRHRPYGCCTGYRRLDGNRNHENRSVP
ncbi:hypothetical protein [Geobacter sp. AOG1]|uniref:hypothetical protein n=1 Tax=Geobacter sp. AOG1 TaxID=1566346 RepID=UPI001CC3F2AF|nr:hypothetical protein [Geobacter sp. AOG1]GFE57551.1 hypothetical protein AOG1_14310 [Geobacter sp. AOG1]